MTDTSGALTPEQIAELKRRRAERSGAAVPTAEPSPQFQYERNMALETDAPDDAAYDLKKSAELGIPREAIAGAREEYRAEDMLRQMEVMRKEAPRTTEWMQQPDNYAVARDDVDTLSRTEKHFDPWLSEGGGRLMDFSKTWNEFFGNIGGAARAAIPGWKAQGAGLVQQQAESLGAYDAELKAYEESRKGSIQIEVGDFTLRFNPAWFGVGDPKPEAPLIAKMLNLEEPGGLAIREPGPDKFRAEARKRYDAVLKPVAAEAARIGREASEEQKALMPKTGDFVADSLLSGVTAFVNMAPSMVGFIAAGPTTGAGIMGGQVYGQTYSEGRTQYNLEPTAANERAVGHALVETISERISLGVIDDIIKSTAPVWKKFVAGMAAEQVQEQGATLGGDVIDWATIDKNKTLNEFFAERPARAAQTALATLVASTGMQGTFLTIDYATRAFMRDAVAAQPTPGDTLLDNILTAASRSKLRTRAPEKAAELAAKLTEGTGAETVVIDLDGLAQSLEAAGLDIMETMTEMGIPAEAINETAIVMGQVEVPTARLMVSNGIQAYRDKVQPHLRLASEDLTPAQKEAIGAEASNQAAKFSEAIREDVARDADFAGQIAEVEEAVTTQLREAGFSGQTSVLRANAVLASRMAAYVAKRRGQDVRDVWKQIGPTIVGQFGGVGETTAPDVLRQAKEAGYQGRDRGEAESWVRAVEKGLDMSTEARMARAKEMGFDTDEVFYHGTGDLTNFTGGFDPKMTGLGNDQLGSGFYFTNQAETASGYTTRRLPTGENKLGGEDAPGVLPVVLNIQNPIVLEGRELLSEKIDVTAQQAEAIIRKSPLINADVDENPLGNWHDIWSEGVQDWMIGDVAASYEGNILAIENDFFRGNSEAFRRAVRDVLGYDGVIQKFDNGEVHKVAWFPEQVRSVHAAFDPDQSASADLLAQSIRAAAQMPMAEVDAWVRANVTASESQLGADTLTVIKFPLTEDPDAPEVMLSIRLKERSNRRDQGRADVNLFLDNQMADSLEAVEDVAQRGTLAKIMFAKTVMVMRQYAAEYDVKAFNFIAAESQAEGTKAKSREALYRFMLSTLNMDGYTAFELDSQMSVVREQDGAKVADPLFPGSGFVLVKDGVNVEEYARNEIIRGRQRGGDAGEVVTVLTAKRLGRANPGDRGGRGRGGVGAADAGSRAGNGRGRDQGRSLAPLPGAPNVEGATGPDPRLVEVAERYAQAQGIDLRRQGEYAQIDPDRAGRIAQAYEEMQHAPNDPAVRAAYEDLIRQTIDQYRALEAAGYRFWLFDDATDPYAGNPWNAMRDLRANQSMGVFATGGGFGSGATDLNVDDNPMLADTGIMWPAGSPDGPLRPVLANDLFRAVHDAFGHGLEGAGFRAQGEENAWQAHVRLFTGPAVGAITSETRGQNSWLNFGPYGESNRTAAVEETVFADQKTGLMPEWTWTEGRVADAADAGGFAGDELAQTAILNDPEVQQALNDPETDVLPLTDDMQVMQLDQFIAFHGTLAKFDEFKTDKIGAGEGAQAFGPGHYFTQSRGIADWYRKRMKQLAPGIRMGKEAFNKANPAHFALSQYWQFRDKNLYHDLFGGYKTTAPDSTHAVSIERAIRWLQYEIDGIRDPFLQRAPQDYASPERPVIRDKEELIRFLEAGIAHLRTLDRKSSKGIPRPSKPVLRGGGNIYTVAVRLPAEQTIQYDKPFGQQSPAVQKAFREAAEQGHLGKAGAALKRYGDATRMDVLVAALKNMKSPAMDVMRANGIRGVRYLDGMSRGKKNRAGQSYNYVVFNDSDVQILDREGKLFQSLDQERRGGFSPSTGRITFTEARDLSTFMHETAHWFLDTLEKLAPTEAWAAADLAEIDAWYQTAKGSEKLREVRARYAVTPTAGGFQVMYQGQPMERPFATEAEAIARIEWRERQEAFAETFEQYLQTGKAPTPKLIEVFRAFRDWLVNLYRGMMPGERAALNPAIREIFDRVLAVDTEVDAASAEAFRDADTMAKDMLAKGVITERQYRMVGERLNKAREEVKEEMIARALQEEMRQREDWWAKEKARIKGDLARKFDKSEVGRAFNWLAYGEWKGDTEVQAEEAVAEEEYGALFQSGAAPTFYSALGKFVSSNKTAKAPAAQWKGMIQNAPGIKAEEVEWTGVMEWLDLQEGPVTREALAQFVEANGVRVEEVVKQAPIPDPQSEFASGPIGQIIRDVLRRGITDRDDLEMTLANERNFYNGMAKNFPEYYEEKEADATALAEMVVEDLFPSYPRGDGLGGTQFEEHTLPGGQNYKELLLTLPEIRGPETHWNSDENVVAHARFKERAGPNGERVLALEEIQSDWHQKGREDGYEQPVDPVAAEETRVAKELAMRNRTTAGNSVISFITEMEKPDLEAFVERLYAAVGPDADTRRDVVETIYATADLRSLSEQKRQMIERRGALILTNMVKEGSLSEEAKAGAAAALDNLAQAALRYREAEQAYMNAAYPGGIANAPFKNNAWTELVLKRMIRYAAENGFDAVAWIPGNIQNGRVVETDDNRGDFYDKIVPNAANKIGKKFGARVGRIKLPKTLYPFVVRDGDGVAQGTYSSRREAEIALENILAGNIEDTDVSSDATGPFVVGWTNNDVDFWTLPITPELRDAAINEGFPLFQSRTFNPPGHGPVTPPPNVPPVRLDLRIVKDLYGEEAVRKLPAAVRRRSSTSSNVTDMLAMIDTLRKTLAKRRKGPQTLTQFIMRRKATMADGTKEDRAWGIKGAAAELKAMGLERLINEKSGRTLDYVREAAEEAGFIRPRAVDADTNTQPGDLDTTQNDLLAALAREARGEAVVRAEDEGANKELADARTWADWLSQNGVDIYETDKKKLRASVEAMLRNTDESLISPDQAAELFGFPNGEELLAALAQVGNRDKFLDEQAERALANEFGDMMKDGTLIEEAREAARLSILGRQSEIELEALSRAVGQQASTNYARQMARNIIALRTVKEIAAYERDLDNERRFSKQALTAVSKGDYATALKAKQRQIIAAQMYREGKKAHERIEKQRKDLLKYLTSESRRDKIANDYLERIDAVLDDYELRVSKQGPGVQKARQSAAAYVAWMTEQGREAEIAPEAMLLATQASLKTWRNLTAEEVDYLVGTIENLAHLGKTKQRLLNDKERREREAVLDELEATLLAAPSAKTSREKSFTPTVGEGVAMWLRKAHARLTRMEFQFARLDGREGGPLHSALFQPFADAADRETARMRDAAVRMQELYAIFAPAERNALFHRRIATPELKVPGKGLTLMDAVVIGLNWGNAGNRQALIDGYGWDGAAIEAMLNRVLTDKHWTFIEGVWDLIGSYRADAFALEKSITGVAPKAVEGISFTLANGRKIEGKYYPLKYDSGQARADSVKQARLDEKQMLNEMGKSFSKPMTKTGHLIERVGSGGKPVKLSIGVFHEHVASVIHDIAYRRSIIDVYKLVTSPRFANAYIQAAGREQYDTLVPWIAQIANERKDEPGGYVTDLLRGARRNFSIMAMGLKVGTAVQQATGVLQGVPLIGTRYAAQGFFKALGGGPASFWSAWNLVSQKSEFMRDRPMGFDRDVREVTNKLQERTPLGAVRRNAFILIGVMDTAVSTGVWIGAYDKALDGNVPGLAKGDEEVAIAFADSIVRRSQVAGRMQDLPQMMRGTELEKLMTVVYSYFSGLYNETASEILRVRGGQLNPLAFSANMGLLYIVIPLVASALAGRLFADDDDDELEEKVAKELASNAVSTIPFARDVINATINPQFGYQLSPAGSIIEGGTKAAANIATGEGFETEYATKQTINLMGLLFGLPTGQLWITGEYVYGVATGEEDPAADPADAAREALLRDSR